MFQKLLPIVICAVTLITTLSGCGAGLESEPLEELTQAESGAPRLADEKSPAPGQGEPSPEVRNVSLGDFTVTPDLIRRSWTVAVFGGSDSLYAVRCSLWGCAKHKLPVVGTLPSLSPDRMRIAYVRGDRIYVAKIDGSGELQLNPGTKLYEASPSFSPDGKAIVYTASNFDSTGRYAEIFVKNTETGATRILTAAKENFGLYSPTFRPDGARVLFQYTWDCSMLVEIDPNRSLQTPTSSTWRTITSPACSANDRDPDYSPDGTQIAFTRHSDSGYDDIYVINRDGTGLLRLTDSSDNEGQPVWSKDGAHILYERHTAYSSPEKLYTMLSNGWEQQPYAGGIEHYNIQGLDW